MVEELLKMSHYCLFFNSSAQISLFFSTSQLQTLA